MSTVGRKNKTSKRESNSLFGLLTESVDEAKKYFVSLVAALAAFLTFKIFVAGKIGWPDWTPWLAFIPPLFVFLWKTVPRLLEWRRNRVFIKSAKNEEAKPRVSRSVTSYFLIGPYSEAEGLDIISVCCAGRCGESN
jgi:hypothetical protein